MLDDVELEVIDADVTEVEIAISDAMSWFSRFKQRTINE